MKLFTINSRSVIPNLLLFLLFVMQGCSDQKSRVEKPGTNDRKIIAVSRPGEKTAKADTIRFMDLPFNTIVCLNENLKIRQVLGPLKTNVRADSVRWELVSASPGFSMEPGLAKGDKCTVIFTRHNSRSTGEILLKVTPFKSLLASKPVTYKFTFQNCNDNLRGETIGTSRIPTQYGHPVCTMDTSLVNSQRRKTITDFRDLLFMYAKTTSAREKEYFKADAENKLNEIPGRTIDILPNNDINDVFSDPLWSNPVVIPLYDINRCYIVGIKVRQQ